MFAHKIIKCSGWNLLVLALGLFLVTACNSQPDFHTSLLVRTPDSPLPVNQPVTVKSRTRDSLNGISHVELYAVEVPSSENSILIRADAAPFDQYTFTAEQTFIPKQPGDYVLRVVGYNKLGQSRESEYIRFTAQ